MSAIEVADENRLISKETWAKVKSGASVAGLAVGTIAVCAVSTFACAYAQSLGYAKGMRDGQSMFPSNNNEDSDRGGFTPTGGFRRGIFERDAA